MRTSKTTAAAAPLMLTRVRFNILQKHFPWVWPCIQSRGYSYHTDKTTGILTVWCGAGVRLIVEKCIESVEASNA